MDWPEITKDTPLEEIKRIHQQIWQYVVENGSFYTFLTAIGQ